MFQTDPLTLTIAVSLVIAFHLLWLVTSLRYNALVLPALAFPLASSISVSAGFPEFELFKFVRIYTSIVVVLCGFVYLYRHQQFGSASFAYLLFVFYFFAAAFYSAEPLGGVSYKGLFVLTTVAGIMYGLRTANGGDFRSLTRQLLVAAVLINLLIGSGLIAKTELSGRINPWLMNANAVGGAAAFTMVIAAYIALYDPNKRLRVFTFVLFFVNLVILLASGSRGSLAKCVIALLIVGAPLFKSPKAVIGVGVALTLGLWITLTNFSPEQADRMLDVEDTRAAVWTDALTEIRREPLFGSGWSHYTLRGSFQPTNFHSVPLQITVDIGLVGLTFAVLLFLWVMKTCASTLLLFSRLGLSRSPLCLAFGLLAAVLVQGLAETGALYGSSIDAFFWGLSIGMVDALRRVALAEAAADGLGAAAMVPWDEDRQPSFA